jgi:hypothetical protein
VEAGVHHHESNGTEGDFITNNSSGSSHLSDPAKTASRSALPFSPVTMTSSSGVFVYMAFRLA